MKINVILLLIIKKELKFLYLLIILNRHVFKDCELLEYLKYKKFKMHKIILIIFKLSIMKI